MSRRYHPTSRCHPPSWWVQLGRREPVPGSAGCVGPGQNRSPSLCSCSLPGDRFIWGGKKTRCKSGIDERFPQEGTSCKRNCLKIQGNWTSKRAAVLSTRETLSIWGKFGFLKIVSFRFSLCVWNNRGSVASRCAELSLPNPPAPLWKAIPWHVLHPPSLFSPPFQHARREYTSF